MIATSPSRWPFYVNLRRKRMTTMLCLSHMLGLTKNVPLPPQQLFGSYNSSLEEGHILASVAAVKSNEGLCLSSPHEQQVTGLDLFSIFAVFVLRRLRKHKWILCKEFHGCVDMFLSPPSQFQCFPGLAGK